MRGWDRENNSLRRGLHVERLPVGLMACRVRCDKVRTLNSNTWKVSLWVSCWMLRCGSLIIVLLFSGSGETEEAACDIRPRVSFSTMSSGSAQDVAVEHFLRDIERRSRRLHCAVIGCEEERPRSDMNLLYRKSRLDWRQRDQDGSKKRWEDQLVEALHMWDYIRVQFSWEINLLATLNEFYFEILNPTAAHKVGQVCPNSLREICIAVLHNEFNMLGRSDKP